MEDGEKSGKGEKVLGTEKGKGKGKSSGHRSDTASEDIQSLPPLKKHKPQTPSTPASAPLSTTSYSTSSSSVASTSSRLFASSPSYSSSSSSPSPLLPPHPQHQQSRLGNIWEEVDADVLMQDVTDGTRAMTEETIRVDNRKILQEKDEPRKSNGKGKEKELILELGWKERIDYYVKLSNDFQATVKAGKDEDNFTALVNTVDFVQDSQSRTHFDTEGPFGLYLQHPSRKQFVQMLLSLSREGVSFQVGDWEDVLVRCEEEEEDEEVAEEREEEEEEEVEEEEGEEEAEGTEDTSDIENEADSDTDEIRPNSFLTKSSTLPPPSRPDTTSRCTRASLYLRSITATVAEHREYSNRLIEQYPAYKAVELAFLHQIRHLEGTEIISRMYGGISGERQGWSRNRQDLKSSKKSTRYRAFVKVNFLEERIENYEFILKERSGS